MTEGTPVPTLIWGSLGRINFSSKHKRAGFNHQVICTLDGKLFATTGSIPEVRHDAYVFSAHELDDLLDSSTLADEGM